MRYDDNMEFKMKELNSAEVEAIGHMLTEAVDERLRVYINRFGAEGAEQFINENTKNMPIVRAMYLARYNARIRG